MEAYPPQSYPPQQGYGYPPQQQGYPQQGYVPTQQYPPQDYKGEAPPSYYAGNTTPYNPQPVQHFPQSTQSTSSNVVVVNSQPTPVIATTVVRPAGDYYLTLSIVLTAICIFCGTWYSLFCTVPAIFIAISARDSAAQGDLQGAQSKGRIALILNIVACVWWVVALIIIVAAIAGSAANASSSRYCYSSSYGSYYYYYCYYK